MIKGYFIPLVQAELDVCRATMLFCQGQRETFFFVTDFNDIFQIWSGIEFKLQVPSLSFMENDILIMSKESSYSWILKHINLRFY